MKRYSFLVEYETEADDNLPKADVFQRELDWLRAHLNGVCPEVMRVDEIPEPEKCPMHSDMKICQQCKEDKRMPMAKQLIKNIISYLLYLSLGYGWYYIIASLIVDKERNDIIFNTIGLIVVFSSLWIIPCACAGVNLIREVLNYKWRISDIRENARDYLRSLASHWPDVWGN